METSEKVKKIEIKSAEILGEKEPKVKSELYCLKQFKGAVKNMAIAGMLDGEDKIVIEALAEKLTGKWIGGKLF